MRRDDDAGSTDWDQILYLASSARTARAVAALKKAGWKGAEVSAADRRIRRFPFGVARRTSRFSCSGYEGQIDAASRALQWFYLCTQKALFGSRIAEVLVLGSVLVVMAWMTLFPDPERIFRSKVQAFRRTLRAESATAGGRWARSLSELVNEQSSWRATWREYGERGSLGIPTLEYPRGRWFQYTGFILMSASGFLGAMLRPVMGGADVGAFPAVIGVCLMLWSLTFVPFRREIRIMVSRVDRRECMRCGYDLTGVPAGLNGCEELGPRVCHECGLLWPLVLPEPMAAEEKKAGETR